MVCDLVSLFVILTKGSRGLLKMLKMRTGCTHHTVQTQSLQHYQGFYNISDFILAEFVCYWINELEYNTHAEQISISLFELSWRFYGAKAHMRFCKKSWKGKNNTINVDIYQVFVRHSVNLCIFVFRVLLDFWGCFTGIISLWSNCAFYPAVLWDIRKKELYRISSSLH